MRKATGEIFTPAPLPPPKGFSLSGFWSLVVKSLPPEAKPKDSLDTGISVTPSSVRMGEPMMVFTSTISRIFCMVVAISSLIG